jgi:hypothetical protein
MSSFKQSTKNNIKLPLIYLINSKILFKYPFANAEIRLLIVQ